MTKLAVSERFVPDVDQTGVLASFHWWNRERRMTAGHGYWEGQKAARDAGLALAQRRRRWANVNPTSRCWHFCRSVAWPRLRRPLLPCSRQRRDPCCTGFILWIRGGAAGSLFDLMPLTDIVRTRCWSRGDRMRINRMVREERGP